MARKSVSAGARLDERGWRRISGGTAAALAVLLLGCLGGCSQQGPDGAKLRPYLQLLRSAERVEVVPVPDGAPVPASDLGPLERSSLMAARDQEANRRDVPSGEMRESLAGILLRGSRGAEQAATDSLTPVVILRCFDGDRVTQITMGETGGHLRVSSTDGEFARLYMGDDAAMDVLQLYLDLPFQ